MEVKSCSSSGLKMVTSRSAPVPAAAAAFASLACASLGELPFKISQLENGCWNSAHLARPGLQQGPPCFLKVSGKQALLNSAITLGLYITSNLFQSYIARFCIRDERMSSLNLTQCSVPTHSDVEHSDISPTNSIIFQEPISVVAVLCGRRNLYFRKPNNRDFSFFLFQKGINVSKSGIFHKLSN